jgi:hypothetical protein
VPGSEVRCKALLDDLLADLAVSQGSCVARFGVPDRENDEDSKQGE